MHLLAAGTDRAVYLNVAGGLAEALVTTAFGLLVAIPAVWCRNYILTSVEIFENEMSNATLETMTYCDSHCHLRHRFLSYSSLPLRWRHFWERASQLHASQFP